MHAKPKLDARHRRRAMIEENAAKVFAEHQITQRLNQGMFRSWRCQRPGTWNYGFDVTTTPGYLFITGDLGEMVVSREVDMIEWARKSVGDIAYFKSKVCRGFATDEFDHDVAREWINESVAEEEKEGYLDADRKEAWYALLRGLDEVSEGEFFAALRDSDLNIDDYPRLTNYTHDYLWLREAIKWFIANLPAEPVEIVRGEKRN